MPQSDKEPNREDLQLLRESYPRDWVTISRGCYVLNANEGPGVAPIRLVEFNGVKVVTKPKTGTPTRYAPN